MKLRHIIVAAAVTVGLIQAFGLVQANAELNMYRNAKNEICQTINRKVDCLSERAYQKEQTMKERRAHSRREDLHYRVD